MSVHFLRCGFKRSGLISPRKAPLDIKQHSWLIAEISSLSHIVKVGNCWIKHHQSGRMVCSLDRFLNNLKNGAFLDSVIDRRDLETGINKSK